MFEPSVDVATTPTVATRHKGATLALYAALAVYPHVVWLAEPVGLMLNDPAWSRAVPDTISARISDEALVQGLATLPIWMVIALLPVVLVKVSGSPQRIRFQVFRSSLAWFFVHASAALAFEHWMPSELSVPNWKLSGDPLAAGVYLLVSLAATAVTEELYFRHGLWGLAGQLFSRRWRHVAVAVPFITLHPVEGWLQVSVGAVIFGLLRSRYDTVWVPIAGHAGWNSVFFAKECGINLYG